MTNSEKLLWEQLRAHTFLGYKFRRQQLDGKHHQFSDQTEYDKARNKLLIEFGVKILRIKNNEVKNINSF